MLPVDYVTLMNGLEMDDQLEEQWVTRTHLRPGPGRDADDWKFVKYLVAWRERFEKICLENKGFN